MAFLDLFRPKWKHSNPEVRKKGVKKLRDIELIDEISKNDEDETVRKVGMETIFEIAKNNEDIYVRRHAVKSITDQSALVEVINNDKDSGVRQTAVRKLTDQSILAEIARKDKDSGLRKTALKKLTDQSILAEIARNDENWEVRKTAHEKLGNEQEAQLEIAKNTPKQKKKSDCKCLSCNNYFEWKDLYEWTWGNINYPFGSNSITFYTSVFCPSCGVQMMYRIGSGDYEMSKKGTRYSDYPSFLLDWSGKTELLEKIYENNPKLFDFSNREKIDINKIKGIAASSNKEKSEVDKAVKKEIRDIGENQYRTVKIGKQIWMAKNLDVEKFRNGDIIPHVKTDKQWQQAGKNRQPAWCNYNNDPANRKIFGKLYNWYAVNDPRGLAPEGWHVPSDTEWSKLTFFVGSNSSTKLQTRSKKNGWSWCGLNMSGTDDYGFRALPGGYRNSSGSFYDMFRRWMLSLLKSYHISSGSFYDLGSTGTWWSSTDVNANDTWGRYIGNDSNDVLRTRYNKKAGISVRCVKDNIELKKKRKEAIQSLTDQEVLSKIADSDNEWSVKKAAFDKITDQDMRELLVMEEMERTGRNFLAPIDSSDNDNTPLCNSNAKDKNMGRRQDTLKQAESFWLDRNVHCKFFPFALYIFDSKSSAEKALLDVSCFVSNGNNEIICTESYDYGCYKTDDGKYEAIICGEHLSIEIWEEAHNSFKKHGGVLKNELKPISTQDADISSVHYHSDDVKHTPFGDIVYKIHKAPNVASAKRFLETIHVTDSDSTSYTYVVETPEGNYCKDSGGFYIERS